MIKTEKLTKVYASGTRAVDGLTFEMKEGEIFGFLGPNGAGKSTAIKMLTTLCRPTSGRAWINGFDIVSDPYQVRKSLGYVAQESGVDYLMTGRENLSLQGHMYRMDGKTLSKRTDELLGLFDLKKEADDLVSTYSGGMRRKLDIATALIHQPKILFLDEPTLGLDPHSRSSLWGHIRALNQEMKVTLFLTTHYLDEADRLSHRIGILHKGTIKVIDTPDALKNSIRGDSVNLSLEAAHKEKAMGLLKAHPLVKELLSEGEHLRVYVDRGSEAIPVLMSALGEHGIVVSTVTLSRPTLDDVYLKYSGVSFKEDAGAQDSNPWWAKWQKKGGWKGKESTSEAEASASAEAPESKDWANEWRKGSPESEPSPVTRSTEADATPAGSQDGWNGAKKNGQRESAGPNEWEKWQKPVTDPAAAKQEPERASEEESPAEPDWKKWQGQWGEKKS